MSQIYEEMTQKLKGLDENRIITLCNVKYLKELKIPMSKKFSKNYVDALF